MKTRISRTPALLGVGILLLWGWVSHSQANHVVLHGGPFLGIIVSIVVDPVEPDSLYVAAYGGGVFRSTDRGVSWVAVNRGLPDRKVLTLLAHPARPAELYLGTDQGIFHTADRGDSWRPAAPVLRERNIRALLPDPTDSGGLYVGTDDGVFRGRQGEWQKLSRGLKNSDVRALASSPQGEVFAATFGGIFKKPKRGQSWFAINEGLQDRQVRSVARVPSGGLYAGTARGGVFKSENGGEHWRPANTGLLNSTVLFLLTTPEPNPALYAGTIDGVFKTVSGGAKWFSTGEELAFTVPAMAFNPAQPNLLYAGSGGWIFKSFDGGKQWKQLSPQVDYFGSGFPSNQKE